MQEFQSNWSVPGKTFVGVMGYVKRYRPPVVICENVLGLMKRTWVKELKAYAPPVIIQCQELVPEGGGPPRIHFFEG